MKKNISTIRCKTTSVSEEGFCVAKLARSAVLLAFVFTAFNLYFNSTPTYAHTASIITSDEIILDVSTNKTTVHNESVEVDSTCSAGYYLTLATSGNSTLYMNGDSSNSASAINPVNSSYALNDNTNNSSTWGFSLTNAPGTVGAFNPLSSTPTTIKTPSETEVPSGSISDIFSVYYGLNLPNSTPPGSYYMADSGVIIYQLTLSESCFDSLVIAFDDNASGDTVTNMPTDEDNTYDTVNQTVTLSNKVPVRSGYIFTSWNTSADGNGTTYRPGETVPIGSSGLLGFVDLYAIWTEECASGNICYNGNGADAGTMEAQLATNGNVVALMPSNFSRAGYGFAGWNTQPDGTGAQYGPNQNFTMPSSGGVNLFAVWMAPSGTFQSWANASSMSVGDVSALRDIRDNEVYTIAKLADNNVWITENLRLIPNTANITAANTNNPTQDFLTAYPSSSASGMCGDDNATCDNSVQFNTNNINRSFTPSYNSNDNSSSWYSYGVMYNWYTATAGNGLFSMSSGNTAGDLCPSGWHMPTGGSGGEWGALNTAVNNGLTNKDIGLRAYPVNIIRSGDYNPSDGKPTGRGTQGRMWSTTAKDSTTAYRMGYSANDASATAKGWNKWDGFAIRCIYQGGNIDFHDVTASFSGTGITSIIFESQGFPTETATPSSATVSIAENVPYTITATTSAGYELGSWATTSDGTLGSTSDNPTTYTVADDTTLTATGTAIPTFTTTVSLGAGVTSVTFSSPNYADQTVSTNGGTVLLKRGEPYTISATYEEGITLDSWSTTQNGTIASPTSLTTIYTITGDTTLTVATKAAELLEYTLNYDAGTGGTGAPASQNETSYHSNYEFTISTSSVPFIFGYHFVGYSETSGASTATYAYNAANNTFTPSTITVASTAHSTTKTLYAVYAEDTCPANKICYFDNGADVNGGGVGTMANRSASSNTSVNLIPSNYSKAGYGFAGWLDVAANGNTPEIVYGPNQTITTGDLSSGGLKLYAKWVQSAGNLQGWRGCNALSQGSVTALTDTRDNQTYAVAKLADDNCWIIENFRLDPATTTITELNTHNPTSTFITQSQAGSGSSLSTNTMCNSDTSACFNQLQYNTNNLDRSLTQVHNSDGNDKAWYGYGVYYNWYTATAGNGTYDDTETSGSNSDGNVAGDICPIGWHLPTGNSTGEYNALNTAINNGATNSDANWRAYPNNFVWAGDYNNIKRNSSYSNGRLWTATAKTNNESYRVGFASSTVTSATNVFNKWDGFIVRCIQDEQAAEYSNVTVTLPTGVSSITFTHSKYGTVTATSENPVVSIAEEATYSVTANLAMGYTFDAWTAGNNATVGNANQNPTTVTITDDATLTLTATAIPAYQVTVTIDEGVTSLGIYNANYGTQTFTPANMTDNGDGTYSGTATLYRNIEYIVTGVYATSYEFVSWSTGTNGTLADATSATTTYTVTGNSTLTLTSQVIPSYTTTVNFAGSGISSVSFVNADYGTQNVTTSGGTVSLRRGVSYTITATAITDYELASWSTTGNGSLGSTTANPTTYTVTDTATLTVTGQEIPATFTWQASTATRPADADVTFAMQDFDTATCNLGTTGQIGWAKDSRDNTVYTIGKLADGKCWMLDNLRLDLTNSTILNGLTTSNTNVDSASLTSLKSGNRSAGDRYATAGVSNWTSSNSYSEPLVNATDKDNTTTSYGAGSGKIGVYYNYCAASAGSYCFGSGTSTGTPSGNAQYDICPKGWRMPTGGDSGEYNTLYTTGYSSDATNFKNALSTPLSGRFYNGSANYQGSSGIFWSSTYLNSYSMYYLYIDSTDVYPTSDFYRRDGYSVRCIIGS